MVRITRCLLALTLLLALVVTLSAAPKKVPLDVQGDTVTIVRKLPCKVVAAPGADFYIWSVPDLLKATSEENVLTITEGVKGSYKVRVLSVTLNFSVDKDGKVKKEVIKDSGEIDVHLGDAPGPGPGPGPGPEPTPPSPAPIPVEGFRVLIIYESKNATEYSTGQQDVLFGKKVRDYLKEKCVLGQDGKTREFRIYDKDISLDGESKHWQDAMKRKRDSIPWIIVSNGKSGHEGAMPDSAEDAIALFAKYAEGK